MCRKWKSPAPKVCQYLLRAVVLLVDQGVQCYWLVAVFTFCIFVHIGMFSISLRQLSFRLTRVLLSGEIYNVVGPICEYSIPSNVIITCTCVDMFLKWWYIAVDCQNIICNFLDDNIVSVKIGLKTS